MVPALKKPLSFDEQLSLLKARGMIIDDEKRALSFLKTANYYRITGYAFQFKEAGKENYLPGTALSVVQQLYNFDARLRNIVIRYLEDIEIYVRSQAAYWFAHEYGSYGHYMPWCFESESSFEEFEAACSAAVEKNRQVPFIAHHLSVYSSPSSVNIPLWALVEILSFSTVSKFYSSLEFSLRKKISRSVGDDPGYFENHLHCMANLRNICAHYGRLYNRQLRPSIRLPQSLYRNFSSMVGSVLQTDSLYGYILAMLPLLPTPQHRSRLLQDLKSLIDEYDEYIDLSRLGMPDKWYAFAEKLCTKLAASRQ